MATTTTAKGQKAVGSREWVSAEKGNVQQLVNQEVEEVEYPVRHEMEWLNEHMAEIFRGGQLDVTEVFKTPGKMRGKTPRTVRKHQTPKTERAPLSEIFSASQGKNSPFPNNQFNQEIQKLASHKDKAWSPLSQNQNSNPNFNTDSGYHGMPDEDDMEMIPSEPPAEPESEPEPEATGHVETATQPLEESTLLPNEQQPERSPSAAARRATEDSFHSAREVAPSKETTVEPMDFELSKPPASQPAQQPTYPKLRSVDSQEQPQPHANPPAAQNASKSPEPSTEPAKDQDLDHHLDDLDSASESSTPDRPPIRKSSLTFASLPAREPLTTTKRSMGGARMSRTSHVDRGIFGRQTGGPRVTQALAGEKNDQPPADADVDKMDVDKMDVDELSQAKPPSDDPGTKMLHNKSSTQRLHEKINMLGKAQASRNTKSISATAQQLPYPDLPAAKSDPSGDSGQKSKPAEEPTPGQEQQTRSVNSQSESQPQQMARQDTAEPEKMQLDAPSSTIQQENTEPRSITRSGGTPDRRSPGPRTFNPAGAFHGKSNSTSSMLRSPRAERPDSRGNNAAPNGNNPESTTPTSSPKRNDGPLSASKSRLRSIMGAARGLFTSSAGASAAARFENLSPTATRTETHTLSDRNGSPSASPPKAQPSSPIRQEGRRTRSSTEREARRKEEEELRERERKEKEEEELAKAREEEKQKAAQPKNAPVLQKLDRAPGPAPKSSPRKTQPPAKQAPRELESSREEESKASVSAISKPKEIRRPVKPTKETQKTKPQPVSIRVGTHSQRMAMSQHQAPPSSVPEPAQQPSASKQPPSVGKKGRAPSLQTTTSANSLKSNSSSASTKSKATLAAERKKEQEAQKKLEQRREAEQKRAAQQQEEARRQEQAESERQERERAAKEDPKKSAQRQAIEKRRLENAKKLEQQRNQQAASQGNRVSTQHQERPGYGNSQRNDQAPSRPPSRMNSIQHSNRPNNQPLPNPAKPPKRNVEDEGTSSVASTKPGVVKQADGKRRKTDEEAAPEAPPTRPTMAPPIRQSNVRKDTMKPGYATAPAQHPQGGPSVFKNPAGSQQFQGAAPGQGQRSGHPLELAKYASGKIPFAESNAAQPQPPHHATHKNPAPQQQKPKSPAHPTGDAIKLPEIPTDSEESDSDAEPYNVPDWAREENLGNILMEQEGHDGDAVFGPSAPLHMEEIFKENKERFKRFRDRTSSANWAATGDGLTPDEVRWDLAERERLKKNGGWTYGKNHF